MEYAISVIQVEIDCLNGSVQDLFVHRHIRFSRNKTWINQDIHNIRKLRKAIKHLQNAS